MTLRNLWEGDGVIVAPQMIMGGHSLVLFMEKSISANLLGEKCELCWEDHSNPPLLLSSMLSSIWCVSQKVFPMARNVVSSTNANVSSCLPLAVLTRSELYMIYNIIERGLPCPIPLIMLNHSDV